MRCHKRASPLTVKNIRIENAKNTKKKTNSITITIKRKYEKKRNAAKIRTHVMTRIKGREKETETQ